MTKTVLLFLCFITLNLYSQKTISISKDEVSEQFYKNLDSSIEKYNLKDLRKSEDKTIRIWKGNEILTLGKDPNYLFHIKNEKQEVKEKKQIAQISNFDSIFNEIDKNVESYERYDQFQIDAFPTVIEINNSSSYRLISFYKNEKFEELIKKIREQDEIEKLSEKIINELPSGRYSIGITTIKIDHLINENQSAFYQKILPEMEQKLGVDKETDPTEMPLILINNKPKYFKNLNELKIKDVQKYEIINDNRKSIYGTYGDFGVIKIDTK